MLIASTSPGVPSDHVVPTTRPPRIQVAYNTNCIVAGEDRTDTGATLANVCAAFGAGDERGRVFPNILPGHELSEEACSDKPLLLRLSSVLESLHCFHVSTARTTAKLAGGRNVPPVVVAPEASRIPVTLVLGMFAYIVAAGNDLGACRLPEK